jgi:hypothetical protein
MVRPSGVNVIKLFCPLFTNFLTTVVFVRLDRKSLKRKNTSLLQKFVTYSREKFYNIGPGVNVIKLFSSPLSARQNKLERFSVERIFANMTRACASGAPYGNL